MVGNNECDGFKNMGIGQSAAELLNPKRIWRRFRDYAPGSTEVDDDIVQTTTLKRRGL